MRRWILSLVLIVSMVPASTRADETGSMMADAARRFVASLDDGQKSRATFAFESPERVNWHWIPRERKGVPIKEMKPDQRALAFGLLNTGLSPKGFLRATTIMSLEEILRVDEHGTGPIRDSELYYVSVFGTPSETDEWGWRIEGHHLALNFTLKNAQVISATPFMFGSNPAEVKVGTRKGLRNLAEIELPSNKLALSMTEAQRKLAVVSPTAPDVTTTPNPSQAPASTPEGLSVEKLDREQTEALTQTLRAYAANFPEPIHGDLLELFSRDPQSVHFAWYGPIDPTKPHAFRVHGSAFFIDFNDTQNQTNHIHTYFRSLLGDFGVPVSR